MLNHGLIYIDDDDDDDFSSFMEFIEEFFPKPLMDEVFCEPMKT